MRLERKKLDRTVSRRLPRRDPIRFAEAEKHQWLWRSYDDLLLDLQDWSARLPSVSAVCGVPRSGVIVASILSAMLNVPLISLEALRRGQIDWRPSVSKPLPKSVGRSILVVDDTVWSGGTLQEVKEGLPLAIAGHCQFGAVYINAANTKAVDTYGFPVESIKHCFAWNYLRDIHSRRTLTDMDGVLCDEWRGEMNNKSTPEYLDFLANVAPRVRPIYPVLGIVTGRVEEHRIETSDWLQRHGIQYQKLIMPFLNCEHRRGQCIGTAKAKVYEEHSEALLFVESDEIQAEVIHRRTGRPVLCTDTLEMIQNG